MYYKMTKMLFRFCHYYFFFSLSSFLFFFFGLFGKTTSKWRQCQRTRFGLTAEMFLIRHKIDGQHSPMPRPCLRQGEEKEEQARLCLDVRWVRNLVTGWLNDWMTVRLTNRTIWPWQHVMSNAGGDAHSTIWIKVLCNQIFCNPSTNSFQENLIV